MANVYPPSPAPSACDSLADIEDLDAFLDAQGQLSHWPTPPPAYENVDHNSDKKRDSVVATYECDRYSDISDDDADEELWRLASALTDIAKPASAPDLSHVDVDVELVLGILLRAAVPPEILALAFNIMRAVAAHAKQALNETRLPLPDLTVTACLSLAVTFTSDKPPIAEYWARDVCKGIWAAHQIDDAILDFLTLPGVNMLAFSAPSAVDEGLRELCELVREPVVEVRGEDEVPDDNADLDLDSGCHRAPAPLRVDVSRTTEWVHGVPTPAETPLAETHSFLPLL